MSHPTTVNPQFWKESVVYQIYPSSFKDSTGSGSGDLNGITSKLPYLASLGVDIVWLSPIYASPMKDMGYDISDYRSINPSMGTLEDWERMVAEAHGLGLKIVMDLVMNHTSDQHEWFRESKKSGKGGPKRDWYYWKPKNERTGKEPNNWGAIFGGSAWEWDEASQEYYLHVFDVSQPDLNWENVEVRNAVWDVMRFWLDKGCDGFRMDVINGISKDPTFSDIPIIDATSPYHFGLQGRFSGPKLKEFLDEMHSVVLNDYPNAFTVGECPGISSPEEAVKLVQHGKPLQMIFNFEHMFIDVVKGQNPFQPRPWKLTGLKGILGRWMSHMQAHDGWDSLYLENHDQPRILGRWASAAPRHRAHAAKMLALFHATGRGTLFLYQGQEIGMANPTRWTFAELRDLEEINYYREVEARRGAGADMSDVMRVIQSHGRDNARTLFQWDDSPHGGFTSREEGGWIKVCEDYQEWNVARQDGVAGSVLEFWKAMIRVRREHRALVYGWFEMVDEANEDVYAYTRTGEQGVYLTACNFTDREVTFGYPRERGVLLLGSHEGEVAEVEGELKLRAYEGRLYFWKK